MLGILVPGSPIITGGPIVSNNVVVDINNPKTVNSISMFLTDKIPDDCGVSLYYSVPPYTSQQFIGCVCNQRPSDTFNTGWSLNQNVNVYNTIKVGAQIEKLANIEMAYKQQIKTDVNQDFAKRVASNLYHYLDSFNENKSNIQDKLVLPINCLDNWYNKFMQKYQNDPNFLMKSDI